MIITCPSCGARYKVRDDLIPNSGKRIKCKKCAALFRAYPDKKAVLEKASPKPESSPAPKPTSSQATVMVDQAKITNFLQQMPEGKAKESEPTQPPPKPAVPSKPSHATVQIDRTKIDAFLQTKVDSAGGDYEPNTTLEVSREELDQFLNKPNPKPVPVPEFEGPGRVVGSEDISPKPKIDESKYQDLQRALGAQFEDPAAAKETIEMPPQVSLKRNAAPDPLFDDTDKEISPPVTAEQEQTVSESPSSSLDQVPISFDDDSWAGSLSKPSFPSDEELGLTEEPESDMLESSVAPDDVSFDDEPEDFLSDSQDDDFLTDNDSEEPVSQEPAVFASDQVSATESTAPGILFSVKVEDTEYPNKSLEALDRWIHEGRLLETDMVAYAGSSQFQKAYDIPEIAAIFDRYFGQSGESETQQPSEKKGFFGNLFSIFSKKK